MLVLAWELKAQKLCEFSKVRAPHSMDYPSKR